MPALLLAEVGEVRGQVVLTYRQAGVESRYEGSRCGFKYFPLWSLTEPESPYTEIDVAYVAPQQS